MKNTMIRIRRKIKIGIAAIIIMLPLATTKIYAAPPQFDESGAKNLVNDWVKPLTSFGLWAVPGVTCVILLISGLMWLQKDEEEKEQKSWKKSAVRTLKTAIVIELVQTIMKILGL